MRQDGLKNAAQKRRRLPRNLPQILFFACVSAYAAAGALIALGMHPKRPETAPQYLIVLGSKVRGSAPGEILTARIDGTEAYLKAHPATVAVLSGGITRGAEISEAECMYRELTARGIAPERLILEGSSKTTEENVLFSSILIPEGVAVGILSSDFHLFRAQCHARRIGKRVSTHAVPTPKDRLPRIFLREQTAVICEYIEGKL